MTTRMRSQARIDHPMKERETSRRWLTFYWVGGLGIVVQLAALAALTAAGLHYLAATALAVEAAILHNFFWHERWTWSDRSGRDPSRRWRRLLRFQIANGALSLAGNLVLMQLLAGAAKMNYTLANILSVALCSVLNFLASDRLVFTRGPLRSMGARFPSPSTATNRRQRLALIKAGCIRDTESPGLIQARALRSCSLRKATEAARPLNTDARMSRPNNVSSSNGAMRQLAAKRV